MKKFKNILVVGFALFSMFFGAGNLIFPPYLGVVSGSQWIKGFSGFILADIGLVIVVLMVMAKNHGDIDAIASKGGRFFGTVLGFVIITCLGPLLAIPRTAATTFEVGVQGMLPAANPVISSIVFFLITLLLTIRPSKVVDIIGEFLTPALLIALAVLIVKGIMSPIGTIGDPQISDIFSNGVSQGYQTMDALGALMLSFVVISSVKKKGYTTSKEIMKATLYSGLIASIGLALVYGGLTYIGATTSTIYDSSIIQTELVIKLTETLLGSGGKVILGIIVALACLTTSIGLVSSAASFYEKFFKGKVSYEKIVIVICIFSAIISNFGVSTIVNFSAPILEVIYPVTMVLVIFSGFSKKIANPNTYKGAAYTTLLVSLCNLANAHGGNLAYVKALPFDNIGFNWIVPAIVGAIIGSLIEKKKSTAL